MVSGQVSAKLAVVISAAFAVWYFGWLPRAIANPIPIAYPCCGASTNCEGCQWEGGDSVFYVLIPPGTNPTQLCATSKNVAKDSTCDNANKGCTKADTLYWEWNDPTCVLDFVGPKFVVLVRPQCTVGGTTPACQ